MPARRTATATTTGYSSLTLPTPRSSLQLFLATLTLLSTTTTQQQHMMSASAFTPSCPMNSPSATSTPVTSKLKFHVDGHNHVIYGHHTPLTAAKLASEFHSHAEAKDGNNNIGINANANNDDYDDYDDYVPMWKIEEVDRVYESDSTTETAPTYPNPLSRKDKIPESWFVEEDAAVAARVNVDVHQTCIIDQEAAAPAFVLAGPRKEIAFDPDISRAAIVTCGGLCPGLNTVVRELVMCLRRQYGVEHVFGIREGYRGFLDPPSWLPLDEAAVANYHNMGGSILGSSRGGHDTQAIVEALVGQNINMLFVVGGDGTLRGAAKIAEEVQRRGVKMGVVCIPKTIDNDIPLSTFYSSF